MRKGHGAPCPVEAHMSDAHVSRVSKIFDFGRGNTDVIAAICTFLRGKKKAVLEGLLAKGGIKYTRMRYDWTSQAKPASKIFGGKPSRQTAVVQSSDSCLMS